MKPHHILFSTIAMLAIMSVVYIIGHNDGRTDAYTSCDFDKEIKPSQIKVDKVKMAVTCDYTPTIVVKEVVTYRYRSKK